MATVRVSFLLGGERFHGRLNRCSILSDVPAKATRVNRAGPGYKVIRLRRLSHARQHGTGSISTSRRTGAAFARSQTPDLGQSLDPRRVVPIVVVNVNKRPRLTPP